MTQAVLNPARGRGRPRSFEYDAVLDAAIPVFWEKGYDGASLDHLTRAMGIGRPSLYSAFGDKRGLFLKVLERYGATIGSCGMVALGEPEIGAALTGFLDRSLAMQTDAKAPGGCLLGSSVGAALGTVDGVDDVLREMDSESETVLADRLKAAVEAGQLRAGFPARERARLLIDLLHAQAHRARAGEDPARLRDEIASKIEAVLR